MESPCGAPQVAVGDSGKVGLPSVESPYGAPQVAVGDSGTTNLSVKQLLVRLKPQLHK